MSECKHPTCGEFCRRPKKEKKVYQLKRSPIKKKKPKSKPEDLPEMLDLAQIIFNKWIRNRDKDKPCISGGGITEDAGHYFPQGKYSGVRFDEMNVNGQSRYDNRFKEGNLPGYLAGLIERYGRDAVEDLEARAKATKFYKWSRDELQAIINKYKL
ncbi:recombination protein NinG [Arachidicoccus terrestris]|uniref:recombination protein NinG n=1 Tax=Arachidicoccus terrestris TaxID=2875539 RepID=UPI001CC535D8|nr:recombination protein NinG [Arachidicoccus terrestris]UAY56237.1 recombination protein NinG [Arachidicoccus terrestris]